MSCHSLPYINRRMEAQGQGCGGGGGGGGEVRRLHVVYFLSREGRIEHPHLIRVHHLSRNGVRLQDVKRWLSELRGKDMPESFSWSYKRRYRTGYVWQDLLDEDLITPISDNEYILKGSEIVSNTLDCDLHSYGEKKVSMQNKSLLQHLENEAKDHKHSSKEAIQGDSQATMDIPLKTSSEIEEESPVFGSETSNLADDLVQVEEKKHSDTTKQESHEQIDKFENSSHLYSSLLSKKSKKKSSSNNNGDKEKISTPASSSSTSSSAWSHSSSFNKSKSYSNGASQVFRNLITCGAVDTKDSTMAMINRRDRSSLSVFNSDSTPLICKGEKVGGSERIFGTPCNQIHHHHSARRSCDGGKSSKKNKESEFSNTKPNFAAYKPVNGPNCSQCGKTFIPKKMHTHMKSCKGTKASAKGVSFAAAFEIKSPSKSLSMDSFNQN
ncbi:protein SOSEKI 1-like [Cornus florida]|uniref:protein SOSEKI 1-like n=1 Tax=Cornus florida TaxID=4283 RepID=UPI00289FDFE4|nr:protein SOSEKI 1-like [Cornus florida]